MCIRDRYGGSQISSEFNAEDFLPQEVEVVKQFNYYQDNFGASAGEVSFIYISGENLATNAVFQAIDETQNQLLIDDTYISGDESGIFSALNGMRNLASNESGYFYNATFAELFNSKDGNNDGVPDTDADVKE